MSEETKNAIAEEVEVKAETKETEGNAVESEKTFTQEDIDRIIKKEKQRLTAKLEQEKLEAERLAKLSENERIQEELKIEREKFENERKQFERDLKQVSFAKKLSENGIDSGLAEKIFNLDLSEEESLSQIIEAIKLERQRAIDSVLVGSKPKESNTDGKLKTEDFKNMTYAEKLELYEKDPEAYKRLSE